LENQARFDEQSGRDPSQRWPELKERHMDLLEGRVGEQVEVVVSSTRSSYTGTLTRVDDRGLVLRITEGDNRSEAYHFYPWYSVLFVSFPVDLAE
jgi:hypothetical protein